MLNTLSVTGQCSNKECQYLHIDPMSKIKDCPWFDRGFCKHGKNNQILGTRTVMLPHVANVMSYCCLTYSTVHVIFYKKHVCKEGQISLAFMSEQKANELFCDGTDQHPNGYLGLLLSIDKPDYLMTLSLNYLKRLHVFCGVL